MMGFPLISRQDASPAANVLLVEDRPDKLLALE